MKKSTSGIAQSEFLIDDYIHADARALLQKLQQEGLISYCNKESDTSESIRWHQYDVLLWMELCNSWVKIGEVMKHSQFQHNWSSFRYSRSRQSWSFYNRDVGHSHGLKTREAAVTVLVEQMRPLCIQALLWKHGNE